MEVLGESIKSALGGRLMEAFPGVTWYKEKTATPVFPHFFLQQLTLSAVEERRGYWWLDYLLTIRYRIASDITDVTNLQEELDAVGLKLLCSLSTLPLGDVRPKIRDARYEKTDGVLHYFCGLHLPVKKEQAAAAKMQLLTLTETLKEA